MPGTGGTHCRLAAAAAAAAGLSVTSGVVTRRSSGIISPVHQARQNVDTRPGMLRLLQSAYLAFNGVKSYGTFFRSLRRNDTAHLQSRDQTENVV